jgi:transposase, IS5 family
MSKGFVRIKKRRQQLESRKDLLSELNRFIPWEIFRSCLDELPKQARKSNAGRKAIAPLLLFKLLILQNV